MKRFWAFILGAFVLIALTASQPADAGRGDDKLWGEHKRNEHAVLKYLVPTLRRAGKVGRIYYAAECPPQAGFAYPFPAISLQPPSEGVSGLAAVRQIFQKDKNVVVEESPPGVIRVRIGRIFDKLLQTHISNITLGPEDYHTGNGLIDAIKSSEEVLAAKHRLGIPDDYRPHMGLGDDGLPSCADSLKNVTMDQALDIVAQSCKGIVEYGTCAKTPAYTATFTGDPNYDVSGDEYFNAAEICKSTYIKKLRGSDPISSIRDISFSAIAIKYTKTSKWDGYFGLTGTAKYVDVFGKASEEKMECKIPETEAAQ